MADPAVHICAAALVLGICVAGPHAAGLASADTPDGDTSSAGQANFGTGSQAAGPRKSTSTRGQRTGARTPRAAAIPPAAATTPRSARGGPSLTSVPVAVKDSSGSQPAKTVAPSAGQQAPGAVAAASLPSWLAAPQHLFGRAGARAATPGMPFPSRLRVGGLPAAVRGALAVPAQAAVAATAPSGISLPGLQTRDLPAPPTAEQAPGRALSSLGINAIAGTVSARLANLVAGLMPTQALAEGAMLLIRRVATGLSGSSGSAGSLVGTAALSATTIGAAAATGSPPQTITLSDPEKVTQGTFTIADSVLYNLTQLDKPGAAVRNYVATYFTAADTASYVFGQTNAPSDTVMIMYNGTFDPANPGLNAMTLNDDTTAATHAEVGATVTGCGGLNRCPQVRADLAAGQIVTLVVTTYAARQPVGLPQTFYANGAGVLEAVQPNRAPAGTVTVTTPDPVTGVVTGAAQVSDADSDPLSFAASTPVNGSVALAGDGSFTYTPSVAARHAAAADGAGPDVRGDAFTITVTDGRGGTLALPVAVTVAPTNQTPTGTAAVSAPDPVSGQVRGVVAVTDADADALSFTATAPSKGSVTVAGDGSFTYVPTALSRHTAAADGVEPSALSDSFTIRVADGHGGVLDVPVAVAVVPANRPPTGAAVVGGPDPLSGQVRGSVQVTDADSDALTYNASAPSRGSVTVAADGSFTYTPTAAARHAAAADGAAADVRSDGFAVTVTDGHGGSVTVPVAVAVSPANRAPTGTVSVNGPDAGGVVSGALAVADGDADALSYSASGPGKGSVTVNADGGFTYTPTALARHSAAADGAPDSARTDSFTVTVSDGHGALLEMAVAVAVAPSNEDPTGVATALDPDANGQVTVSVQATDTDADALTYTASNPSRGSVVSNPDGTYTYTPNTAARHDAAADNAPPSALSDGFTLTISDGHGATIPVPVVVAVSPANAVPTGTLALDAPSGDGTVTGAVQAADGDSDALSFSASTPAQGSVVVNPDGTFVYTPVGKQSAATDSFTITVTDGYGGVLTVPVTVTAPSPETPAPVDSGNHVAVAVDVIPEVVAVAVIEPALAVEAAPEVAEPVAAAPAAAGPAAAPAAPAAAPDAVDAARANRGDGSGRSAKNDSEPKADAKPEADADSEAIDDQDTREPRVTTANQSGQQHAAMKAGKSAGTPFPPSAEAEETSDAPYAPSSPAGTLGILAVLLMAIPIAEAASSAAVGAVSKVK